MKGSLKQLGTMRFIDSATNIIIQGFTGSGKTYLSCALAKEACKKDIKTYTIRLPELLQKRSEEKILHRENKYLHKLATVIFIFDCDKNKLFKAIWKVCDSKITRTFKNQTK